MLGAVHPLLRRPWPWLVAAAFVAACGGGGGDDPGADAADLPPDAADVTIDAAPEIDAGNPDAPEACATRPACAAVWEQHAADRLDAIVGDPVALATFLAGTPKGGDLHNHLSGAVYAETLLGWARTDGDCINSTTFAAVYSSSCSTSTQPTPTGGVFYDQIVAAWSMEGFVPGAQTGHDHFFATFGKFGAVAGAHRDDTLADVASRAAAENQVYVETMFNLGTNVGSLAASTWSGAVTAADLPAFYDMLMARTEFAARLTSDVNAVNGARTGYRTRLGCSGATPPAACDVGLRFVAQISRTGANDQIFGQLVSAFEMAAVTPQLVAANLSSPEDDATSLRNYDLHMAMIAFLRTKYTDTGRSPLHITLHAGELTAAYLPAGSIDNTFHIRHAVETAKAERIGHGLDVLTETDPDGLMDLMRTNNVLVEVCLSSNDQILEVRGATHPLARYLARGVPVALATDDQGVSRSSMAGEYARAVRDQQLGYRQLKTLARNSLEHAFLPGASVWQTVGTGAPVAACATTDAMAVGDPPTATCAAFLAGSERARTQWELERRFLAFESLQPGM